MWQRMGRTLARGRIRPLDARLLFIHVPKCGGNSVRTALREVYNWPLSNSRRRSFNVSPRRSHQVADSTGRPVAEVRDELLRYHLLDKRVRLATGHFAWPAGLRDEHPDLSFATVLREPVSRFLSRYFHAREERSPDRSHTSLSLEAFLDGEHARRIGTTYARIFAHATPENALDPEVLDLAKRRLKSVEVLGVLEDLPGFADSFRERFGAGLVFPRANVGTLRKARERDEVSDALRERIAELVRSDAILYDFACEEIASRGT